MSKPVQRPSGSRGRWPVRPSTANRRGRRPAVEVLEPYVLMAVNVFDVTNTADDGAGSLRQAMNLANGVAGPSEIDFQIPGGGPVRIMVGSNTGGTRLPTTLGTLFINGYSEGNFQHGTTAYAGPPLVVIDGTDAPGTNAFDLGPGSATNANSNGSEIQGLDIVNFSSVGTNGGTAITIEPSSTGDIVSGNYLGVAADGLTAAPNGNAGVFVSSPGNTIGGPTAADRNVISGNGQAGVVVASTPIIGPVATNNIIEGNYIGTDPTGSSAIPNLNGVVLGGAVSTTVGGAAVADRNLISGNTIDGILVTGDGFGVVPSEPTSNNVIVGNFLGTNAAGAAALGNGRWGIDNRDADHTRIGGIAIEVGLAPGNVVSGNGNFDVDRVGTDGGGIDLFANPSSPAASTGATISGNLIGTDLIGTGKLPNTEGVVIAGASDATVGGANGGDGNIISGNGTSSSLDGSGIVIIGTGATGDLVEGNLIGAAITGDAPLGNYGRGVYVGDAADLDSPVAGVASGALIGGSVAQGENIIVANGADGVTLQGNPTTPTTGDVVEVGSVGIYQDLTSSPVSGNAGDGLHAVYATGASIFANTIQENHKAGVFLQFTSSSTVRDDLIIANGDRGISIEGTSQNNIVLKNSIVNNIGSGVAFCTCSGALTTANGNLISRNSIFGNKGIGISFNGDTNVPTPNTPGLHTSGPNLMQNYPVLSSSSVVNGDVVIHGTLGSLPDGVYTVEFFSNPAADPSGHGQGQTYFTSAQVTVTNGVGTFNVDIGRLTGAFITATATDANQNTSEFSASLQAQSPIAGPSMTTLTASPNPSTFGETVSFSVTVSAGTAQPTEAAIRPATLPVPTGAVTLLQGMQPLGSGTLDASGHVTINLSSLPVGTHTIDAVFTGDANYNPSSSNLVNQVVDQAASKTTLAATPNPSAFGAAVTFTATVTGMGSTMPTGTVTFLEGMFPLGTATLDASGRATIHDVPPAVGSNTIDAVYLGDANYTVGTSATINQVVNPAPTRTALTSTPNPSAFGQYVTFTATVTPAGVQAGILKDKAAPGKGKAAVAAVVPTGTVTFLEGMEPLGTATLDASGHASLHFFSPPVGSNTIYALYQGDNNFAGSDSTTINQVVNPGKSRISVVTSSRVVTSGKPVTLTATVGGQYGVTPTGTVTFLNGKVRLGTSDVDTTGLASLTLTSLPAGTNRITAVYDGDATFAASTSTVASIVVNPASTAGPRVTKLVRYGFHAQPTIFVISFNGPLDPARAQNPLNYTLVGPVGGLGRGGQPIAIAQAIYDPSAHTVTLLPARALNVHVRYKLTVHGTGPTAVAGPIGVALDGSGAGRPGSDYVTIFGRSILVGAASAYQVPPPVVIPTPPAAAVDSPRARGSLRFWGNPTGR